MALRLVGWRCSVWAWSRAGGYPGFVQVGKDRRMSHSDRVSTVPWAGWLLGLMVAGWITASCSSDDEMFGPGSPGTGTGGSATSSGQAGEGGSSSTSTGTGGSSASSGTGGGGGGTAGAGGTPVGNGCSDGTREYLSDAVLQPNMTGCSGGFSIAGVTTPASLQPACGRVAGNDSINPTGTGCSVEDLCSEGFHVCHGAVEVAEKSASGNCPPSPISSPTFWLTRQVQNDQGSCSQPPNTNNLTGCGTVGSPPPSSCLPLDRFLRYSNCDNSLSWSCGSLQTMFQEAALVTKSAPSEGGVLCCRD
ncbi:MAG: hypothetical protein DRI90_10200 [Deltaproteobacteria bacterium]|nr:MAG: hypothetical protein DRI90_10200 [Deltaproteobacteria bacterium]